MSSEDGILTSRNIYEHYATKWVTIGTSGGVPVMVRLSDPKKLPLLIAKARAGDAEADYALKSIAIRTMSLNRTLPEDLREYVCDVLKTHQPKKRQGKKTSHNFARDEHIVEAVKIVLSMGFDATRNRGTTKKESACSIVAHVLGRYNLSERAVEEIWASRRRPEDEIAPR